MNRPRVVGERRVGRVTKVVERNYLFIELEEEGKGQKDVYAHWNVWSRLERRLRRQSVVSCVLGWTNRGWRAEKMALVLHRDAAVLEVGEERRINAALKDRDRLPEAVSAALGTGNRGAVRREGSLFVADDVEGIQVEKLVETLRKSACPGFAEWLDGARGWRVECEKEAQARIVKYLDGLQKAYKKRMRALDAPTAKALFYQFGHETDKTKSRAETWTLGTNLKSYVERVRSFLEVLLFYKTDPTHRWTNPLDWLDVDDRDDRWRSICDVALRLMRTARDGPDVPVQWAAHQPRNFYRLTVVTEAVLLELVLGLAAILRDMFRVTQRAPFLSLSHVDELLAHLLLERKPASPNGPPDPDDLALALDAGLRISDDDQQQTSSSNRLPPRVSASDKSGVGLPSSVSADIVHKNTLPPHLATTTVPKKKREDSRPGGASSTSTTAIPPSRAGGIPPPAGVGAPPPQNSSSQSPQRNKDKKKKKKAGPLVPPHIDDTGPELYGCTGFAVSTGPELYGCTGFAVGYSLEK